MSTEMVASVDKIGRREFLRAGLVFGAGAAGLAAGYAAVPDVFARAMYAAKQEKIVNDKVLVMIQLAGGNDGLQTVMPLADASYRDLRPQLSKSADEALPISKDFGLNKNLVGTKKLWDDGKLAIVQGVGYLKPSLSHFDSIRVWETADPDRRQQDGWLGKTIADNYDSAGHPLVGCACGTTGIPGALRDLEATLTVVNSQQSFKWSGGDEMEKAMGALYTSTPGIYGALFDTAVTTARDTVAQLKSAGADHGTSAPVFLMGDTVKGGLYGAAPSLSKLDTGGNLAWSVDFRSVYQEILDGHLEVDAKEVFSQSFDKLAIIRA